MMWRHWMKCSLPRWVKDSPDPLYRFATIYVVMFGDLLQKFEMLRDDTRSQFRCCLHPGIPSQSCIAAELLQILPVSLCNDLKAAKLSLVLALRSVRSM
jgi:hypothetical protein